MRLESINGLYEADLSRRDFLKWVGKGAAAAASPKSAIKGLIGGSKAASATVPLPNTPAEMKLALLKWIKDKNLEKLWQQNALNYVNRPEVKLDSEARKKTIKMLVDGDRDEVMSFADPVYDEPQYIEDLQHVLNSFQDDAAYRDWVFGGPLPEWITRYRLSQWAGKPIDINNPLIKNRDHWTDFLQDWEASPEAIKQFESLIKQTVSPERYKELMGDESIQKPEDIEDRSNTVTQDDYDRWKEFKDAPPPQEEPDSWHTQHVEFEDKLVSRLRRL